MVIHKRVEGGMTYQGLNYCDEGPGGFNLIVKLWRLIFYIRRRPDKIWDEKIDRNISKRWIWAIDWKRDLSMAGIRFNFELRTLDVEDVHIPIEELDKFLRLSKEEEVIQWQQARWTELTKLK